MDLWSPATEFAGLPVLDSGEAGEHGTPEAVAWRVVVDYDSDAPGRITEPLERLAAAVGPERVRALVISDPDAPEQLPPPVEELAAMAAGLPALRAVFLADVGFEECEISWILQDDLAPLLRAYPALEVLWVRGAQGLALGPLRHEALRELVVQSGGLPGTVVRGIGASEFPALRHLELWLGVDDCGGDATVEDLAGVLSGRGTPALRYLGLRDAGIADQVAAAAASAPVVAGLDVLDLSMGALSDDGALALLGGQPLSHLRRLDLSHHFLSEELVARLPGLLPGVEVDLSDRRETDDDGERYVAVSE